MSSIRHTASSGEHHFTAFLTRLRHASYIHHENVHMAGWSSHCLSHQTLWPVWFHMGLSQHNIQCSEDGRQGEMCQPHHGGEAHGPVGGWWVAHWPGTKTGSWGLERTPEDPFPWCNWDWLDRRGKRAFGVLLEDSMAPNLCAGWWCLPPLPGGYHSYSRNCPPTGLQIGTCGRMPESPLPIILAVLSLCHGWLCGKLACDLLSIYWVSYLLTFTQSLYL